ncbi:hypothetical protein [Thiohalocapsa marina]|uniref:hypothetical protein n=1 Tax=Thiohalocapsa marina TaxID=424902 RepID=UPI0036DDC896
MNDLLDDLRSQFAKPSAAEGRLPDKLRLLDIGRLAHPEDGGKAIRFALILHRAVESGDLKAARTGTFYHAHPANMQAVMRHVVDRTDFAAFLQAQGKQPTGRIAEWVTDALGTVPARAEAADIPERPRGRDDINGPAVKIAIDLMRAHPDMNQIEACRQAVERHFTELADSENDPQPEREAKADLRESKARSIESRIRKEKRKPEP